MTAAEYRAILAELQARHLELREIEASDASPGVKVRKAHCVLERVEQLNALVDGRKPSRRAS